MQSGARDGDLWVEPFVQDSGGDLDEGAAEPRAPGRAERKDEPLVVEGEARRHHAAHPLAGLERPANQVGLAQHAVQMQIESRQEIAGAQAEARRQHAGAPFGIDGGQSRGVTVARGATIEHLDEQERPLSRGQTGEHR